MYKNWIDNSITKHHPDGTTITTHAQIDWEIIRRWRADVLRDCDWWGLKDLTMSQKKKDYRQFLRDLPQNYTNANDALAAIMAYEEPE